MNNDIEGLIPGQAKQDIIDVNTLLELTVDHVVKLVQVVRQIDFGGLNGVKSLKDFAVGMQTVSDTQKKLANQTQNYTGLVDELTVATTEYAKTSANTVKTQAQLNVLSSEEAKTLIQLREEKRKNTLEIKNQLISQNAAIGSLEHLRAELNQAKAAYTKLSAETRNSDFGKALLLQVNRFDTEVKRIEESIGVHSRSVGNYGRALQGVNPINRETNQLLREMPNFAIDARVGIMSLTNNISYWVEAMKNARSQGQSYKQILSTMGGSLFGLVGMLNLAITALTYFSLNMSESKKETNEATDALLEHKKALLGIIQAGKEQVDSEERTLRVMNSVAQDRNVSDELRLNAVKKLRDQYPAYLKNYTDEAIMAGEAKEAIEGIATAIEAKVRSEKAAEKAAKDFNRLNDAENGLLIQKRKVFNDLEEAKKNYAELKLIDREDLTDDQVFEMVGLRTLIEKLQPEYNKLSSDVDAYTKSMESATRESEKFAKEAGSLMFPGEREKKGPSDETLEKRRKALAAKELEAWRKNQQIITKAQFDAQKMELESQIKHNLDLATDDEASTGTRIDALNAYFDLKRQLIEQTYEFEKMQGQKSASEIEAIENQKQTALFDLTQEVFKHESDITAKSLELAHKADAEKAKIQEENARRVLKNAEISRRLDEEEARRKIALMNKVARVGEQAAEFINQYNRASFERSMDRLDREDESNKRNTDNEIARIERSALSKEEKEEAIIDAQLKGEAKRIEIENRQIAKERQRAAFEKKIALFKIALSTSLAVAKELESKGVAGIATSGAILAFLSGTVAAAGALAIPEYAEGTDNHKGGLAIVGDGGEQELIKLPSGKSFFSPATDTLMNLPRGTGVTPLSDLIEQSNGMLTPQLLNSMMLQSGGNTGKMERLMSNVADGIERLNRKPVSRVVFSGGYVYETINTGNTKKELLRKNVTD